MEEITKEDSLIYRNASGKLESSPVIVEMSLGKAGYVSLLDPKTHKLLGTVSYELQPTETKKLLKFEGLVSHVEGKGVATKLILELIKISKQLGAEDGLVASASTYNMSATARPLTNIPFYYKLGFQAKNPNTHNEILKSLKKNEPFPLKLNHDVGIELSKEAAAKLEQKAAAKQQEFEKQNETNTSVAEKFEKATEDLQQKLKLQIEAQKANPNNINYLNILDNSKDL